MAEAVVRFLAAQHIDGDIPLFAGVWAIFGHGNVAGLGPGAARRAPQAAHAARAQRAGHGARRDRLSPRRTPAAA
jgi:3D-(3,5/4)-trihydroxycyclohexane-1,2-dione acylhydrolase (decyclizing)